MKGSTQKKEPAYQQVFHANLTCVFCDQSKPHSCMNSTKTRTSQVKLASIVALYFFRRRPIWPTVENGCIRIASLAAICPLSLSLLPVHFSSLPSGSHLLNFASLQNRKAFYWPTWELTRRILFQVASLFCSKGAQKKQSGIFSVSSESRGSYEPK